MCLDGVCPLILTWPQPVTYNVQLRKVIKFHMARCRNNTVFKSKWDSPQPKPTTWCVSLNNPRNLLHKSRFYSQVAFTKASGSPEHHPFYWNTRIETTLCWITRLSDLVLITYSGNNQSGHIIWLESLTSSILDNKCHIYKPAIQEHHESSDLTKPWHYKCISWELQRPWKVVLKYFCILFVQNKTQSLSQVRQIYKLHNDDVPAELKLLAHCFKRPLLFLSSRQ